ncbi:MAG: hypothetical protein LBV16_06860 [Elusimicrobiota bacterium]|jgi:hypothetical protein|nr:hypothetical protein [Elusimicrobiota bacterium]
MKKTLSALLILILISAFVFSKDSAKQLLEADPNFQFQGYAIINDALFVASWTYEGDEQISRRIYKYENNALKRLVLNEAQLDSYWNQVIPRNDRNNNRIDIDKGIFIEIIKPNIFNNTNQKYSSMDYFLILSDNDQQTLISKDYMVQMFENYIYFNKDNNKLYFCAKNDKQNAIGIVEYDIKKKKFDDFEIENIDAPDKKIFQDPIKPPKSSYLLYRTETGEFWIKPIK